MNMKQIFKDNNEKYIPFYAWECITLQGKFNNINLVIKSQKDMKNFLRFLIFQLNTIDGNRGTANPIINTILRPKEAI